MARFNATMLEVRDLNKDMTISTIKRDLRGSRFTYSLDKILPRTYAELLECVYKYMRMDEGASDQRQTENKGQKKKQKKNGAPVETSRLPSKKQASPRRQSLRPTHNRYNSYTPLFAPHAQILMEIEEAKYLRYPSSMKVRNRDRSIADFTETTAMTPNNASSSRMK